MSGSPRCRSESTARAWPRGTTRGDGLRLWEEAYAPYNLVPRPGPGIPPQMAGWFRKKINAIGDYKGLKMRIPGLGGKVVAKAGGTAVLTPGADIYASLERGVIDAAEWMRMTAQALEVRNPGDLEETYKAIIRARPGALLVMADRFFLHNRQRLMDFATKQRLPGVYAYRELVEAGGLMSFGPSYPGMHRRAAYFVDKILKGAKPADLPVERPTKFELVVNLKAATALGLTIPQSILLRADQVIE